MLKRQILNLYKILVCITITLLASNINSMQTKIMLNKETQAPECKYINSFLQLDQTEELESISEQELKIQKLKNLIKEILTKELHYKNKFGECIPDIIDSDESKIQLKKENTYYYSTDPKPVLFSHNKDFALGEVSKIDRVNKTTARSVMIKIFPKYLIAILKPAHSWITEASEVDHNVKIFDTESGSLYKEFKEVSSFKIFGKNKEFLKFYCYQDISHVFVNFKTGLESSNLEDIV